MEMNQSDGPKKLPGAETTVSSETIFEGRIITLQVDQVKLPGGKMASREIVRHPGAAAVIALLDGKLLTVGQYRKPMDKYQVEIPAGQAGSRRGPCGMRRARAARGDGGNRLGDEAGGCVLHFAGVRRREGVSLRRRRTQPRREPA
ncbi:hypothetical protein BN871_CZ_00160 [Paenibacillus sp. P22]|nr:hypothetical protein BN871_CZ_00160 [Paenibacillus sp. P22]